LENTDANSKPKRAPEGGVSERSTEYHAKFAAPHPSSEREVTRLELERQPSVLLSAQTERDQRFARLTDELALKSALLEQAEANAADRLLMQTSLVEQRDAELVDMQAKLRITEAKLDELVVSHDQQVGQCEKELGNVRAKFEANESELKVVRLRLADAEKGRTSLDELVVSRDQQVGQYEKELGNVRVKLEATESELEAVRLRLADAEKGWTSLDVLVTSRDQQVKQYEKELTNVRAKLEAKESELEAVRLRLTDAEKGLIKSKAEADTLQRAQNATGSVNRDMEQVTSRLLERVRVLEVEA
jgi:chromosome segregation ATPase